jgi:hypothetical protein
MDVKMVHARAIFQLQNAPKDMRNAAQIQMTA